MLNESNNLLRIGSRIARIINTGKLIASIAGNAGKKKYQPEGYRMKRKIKAPASKIREEVNHILAASVDENIIRYF